MNYREPLDEIWGRYHALANPRRLADETLTICRKLLDELGAAEKGRAAITQILKDMNTLAERQRAELDRLREYKGVVEEFRLDLGNLALTHPWRNLFDKFDELEEKRP